MKFELLTGSYKSIEAPFSWDDIPQFAILTGENGAGKTQLLEIMGPHSQSVATSFSNPSFEPHEVLFLSNFSAPEGAPNVGLHDISNDTEQLLSALTNKRKEDHPFEQARILRIRAELEKNGIMLSELNVDTLNKNLPKGFLFRDPTQLYREVGFHLFNYHLDAFSMRADGHDEKNIVEKLGTPPWDTLNMLFDKSSLRYKLQTPDGKDIRSKYQMALADVETGKEILLQNLSSGEIALLRLYFWLFIADNKFSFPKLVLLDEPDSHLEPALIYDFINSLKSGLVDGLGAHVIMSTHRTETVAFAPSDSVYEMHARPARIEKSRDRGKTISLLTQNLITIVGDKRPIFVEDKDDEKFYSVMFGLYVDENPGEKLKQLVFVPLPLGKGGKRESGGASKVIQQVRRLRLAGLYAVLRGIIDRDKEATPDEGIFALSRYSIENYLLDPLVIYAVLLDSKQQPTLDLTCEIKLGEDYKIRDFSEKDMQAITKCITSELAQKLTPPLTTAEEVAFRIKYTNGKGISVPQWLIDRRGHELMAAAHGKWPVVQPPSLLKALEKIKLLPEELRTLFENVLS